MAGGSARCTAKMDRQHENFITMLKRKARRPVMSVGEELVPSDASSDASGFRRSGILTTPTLSFALFPTEPEPIESEYRGTDCSYKSNAYSTMVAI